jgi:hypothetical protein
MGFAKEYQGWSVWADKFKPIKNKFSKHDELMFETYGEEYEFIQSLDPRYVWTNVQGDMSDLLVAGVAYVNRLCYYVCEIPWEDDMDTVLLSVETECECYDYEADEGKEDCQVCQGYGLVTRYVGE